MSGRIDKMLFGEVVVSDTIGVSDGFTKLLRVDGWMDPYIHVSVSVAVLEALDVKVSN